MLSFGRNGSRWEPPVLAVSDVGCVGVSVLPQPREIGRTGSLIGLHQHGRDHADLEWLVEKTLKNQSSCAADQEAEVEAV